MFKRLQFSQLWAMLYQTKKYLEDSMLFPNLLKGKEIKCPPALILYLCITAALLLELVTQRKKSRAQVSRR